MMRLRGSLALLTPDGSTSTDYGPTWDRRVGSAKAGGRWNPVGYSVVYRSADSATAMESRQAVRFGTKTLVICRANMPSVAEHAYWSQLA